MVSAARSYLPPIPLRLSPLLLAEHISRTCCELSRGGPRSLHGYIATLNPEHAKKVQLNRVAIYAMELRHRPPPRAPASSTTESIKIDSISVMKQQGTQTPHSGTVNLQEKSNQNTGRAITTPARARKAFISHLSPR